MKFLIKIKDSKFLVVFRVVVNKVFDRINVCGNKKSDDIVQNCDVVKVSSVFYLFMVEEYLILQFFNYCSWIKGSKL